MKPRKIASMFYAWLLIASVGLSYLAPWLRAELVVLRVPQDYQSIQDAINSANFGDTIIVAEGTYNESLAVDKSVSLIGQSKWTTIISGNGTGDVVTIFEPFVTISGFTIKNGYRGITVLDSINTAISDNVISGHSVGVLLSNFNFSIVNRNIVTENSLTGIALGDAYNNTVAGNIISKNKGNGIGLVYSSNNTIIGNTIDSNSNATKLTWNSINNTVTGNIISNNRNGIILEDSPGSNLVYHNNFVNNTKQAMSISSRSLWDNTYPSGGNYWSDYTGTDDLSGSNQDQPGGDGIGDTPYIIDTENQDRYPLMNQLKLVTDLTPPTTSDKYDGTWRTVDFFIALTATDDFSGIAETYYKINGGPTMNISGWGQALISTESANNTLEYWSTDLAGNEEAPHKTLTSIKLDKTDPSISFITPLSGSEIDSSAMNVTWNGSDETSGISHYIVKLDGEPWINSSDVTFHEFTNVSDGSHRVYVRAVDNAGRSLTVFEDFTVNTADNELSKNLWLIPVIGAIIIVLLIFLYRRRGTKARQRRRLRKK